VYKPNRKAWKGENQIQTTRIDLKNKRRCPLAAISLLLPHGLGSSFGGFGFFILYLQEQDFFFFLGLLGIGLGLRFEFEAFFLGLLGVFLGLFQLEIKAWEKVEQEQLSGNPMGHQRDTHRNAFGSHKS